MVFNIGGKLLHRHRFSPSLVVMDNWPTYPWKEWKFQHSSKGYWPKLAKAFERKDPKAIETMKEVMEALAERHQIQIDSPAQWLTLTSGKLGPTTFHQLSYFGGHLAIARQLGWIDGEIQPKTVSGLRHKPIRTLP